MEIKLRTNDGDLKCKLPHDGAVAVDVELACPGCKVEPMAVRTDEREIEGHDTYVGTAYCCACKTVVGQLRVKMSTVFGLEEDERVLNGRPRVY